MNRFTLLQRKSIIEKALRKQKLIYLVIFLLLSLFQMKEFESKAIKEFEEENDLKLQ